MGLSKALTNWLIAVYIVAAIAAVAHAVLEFLTLDAFNGFMKSTFRQELNERLDDWESVENSAIAMGRVFGALALTAFVLLVVWTFRAHRASQLLWAGRRRWSIGWTVGGWFIPGAQFVVPKLVLNEIERIAAAPRVKLGEPMIHIKRRTAISGWIWWVLTILGAITSRLGPTASRPEDLNANEVRSLYIIAGGGSVSLAVGLVAGALYVRRIGDRLSPVGLKQLP